MDVLYEVLPRQLSEAERTVLSYLPPRIAREAKRISSVYGGTVSEIRLRSGGVFSLTALGKNVAGRITVTREECAETFRLLCRRSVYSYADTIREGYVTTPEGIRAGICGRAVTGGGGITALAEISSICIRIPHRMYGVADEAYKILKKSDFRKNMLVWSPPGMGKTTLLRELAVLLASGEYARRVALIDTRYELGAGIAGTGLMDILTGYPRSQGMEIAKRTLSPQIMICDELSTADDTAAVRGAACAGITVIASVHASSRKDIETNALLCGVKDVFGVYMGLLSQTSDGYTCDIFER